MLVVLDPLAAYREDLARSGRESLGPDVGAWIEIAVLLRRIGQLPDEPGIREAAEREITRRLDEIGLPLEFSRDEVPRGDPGELFTRIRLLVDQRPDRVRAASLATALLHAAELAYPADECGRGRSMAQRADIARHRGSLEVAEHLLREVLRIARRRRSAELTARASNVYGMLFHDRGNYPQVERWARRALASATTASLAIQAGIAHQGLMVTAAVRRDFDTALYHGWQAYKRFAGQHNLEATVLLNMSKLLLDCGRPSTAVHGFIATIASRPFQWATLVAWGGLSLAAAGIGDVALVELASDRVMTMTDRSALPYAEATALVNCAQARAQCGMPNERWITRASELAERGGFHEVSIEIDELRSGYGRWGGQAPGAPRTAPSVAESETLLAGPRAGEVIDALESMARIEDVYTVA
jgi:hypothetical protein